MEKTARGNHLMKAASTAARPDEPPERRQWLSIRVRESPMGRLAERQRAIGPEEEHTDRSQRDKIESDRTSVRLIGRRSASLRCVLQLEGEEPGKYDGPLVLSCPYGILEPAWRVGLHERLHQIMPLQTGSEDFKKEIARLDKDFEALQETQTRPCAAGGAISKESVATRLGNELYRRRLGRLWTLISSILSTGSSRFVGIGSSCSSRALHSRQYLASSR